MMLRRLLLTAALLILPAPAAWAQTAMPTPVPTFFNASGAVCALCTLETFAAGTSTPLATYTDAALTTPHANPVVMSAVGRPSTGTPIFLSATSYKFILKTAAGATVWSADNISSVPASITGVSSAGDVEFRVDTDNNGTNVFSFLNGTNVQVAQVNESGDLQLDGTATIAGPATVGGTFGVTGAITSTAGQFIFPAAQVAAAGANTLDDYEEGSWTPVIGGSGGTSGQAYATQVGRYVKIGRMVYAQFNAVLSTEGTITTSVQIQGLPFTAENVSGLTSVSTLLYSSLATNWVNVIGRVVNNTTTADVIGAAAAAATNATALTSADTNNTTAFEGVFIYRATN